MADGGAAVDVAAAADAFGVRQQTPTSNAKRTDDSTVLIGGDPNDDADDVCDDDSVERPDLSIERPDQLVLLRQRDGISPRKRCRWPCDVRCLLVACMQLRSGSGRAGRWP